MKFRFRIFLVFLLAGMIPVLISSFFVHQTTKQTQQTYVKDNLSGLKKVMENYVQDRVGQMGKQIQQYAILHPETDLADRYTLSKDGDLAMIVTAPIGENGYAMVYDTNFYIVFHTNYAMVGKDLSINTQSDSKLWQIISGSLTNSMLVDGYYETRIDTRTRSFYLAVQRITGTNLIAAVATDSDSFLKPYEPTSQALIRMTQDARTIWILLAISETILIVITAIVLTNLVASPIEWMASTAHQLLRYLASISKGMEIPNLAYEIDVLNHTFGILAKQLREQVNNLENMVKERTAELARRTSQVETAAQVARESAAILDVDQLLRQATHLIAERFGFYHVGIFLIDPAGEYAVLKATNSEGGQRMLARNHKLHVGQGVVGHVASKKEIRIVSEVGRDSVHFKNADLPYTRSEMALPLQVRDQVIGVLDIQSTDPSAYKEEDMRIIQLLADQLGLAIETARLYNESQRAIQELEVAYGQQARRGWQERLAGNSLVYTYNRLGVSSSIIPAAANDETAPAGEQAFPSQTTVLRDGFHEMNIPLMLRDQVLGFMTLRRESDQSPWSEEEIQVVREAAIQVASTLENARLLEEIQQRAQQESIISQISARVQTSLDVETVLKTAVREIGLALAAARVEISLGNEAAK